MVAKGNTLFRKGNDPRDGGIEALREVRAAAILLSRMQESEGRGDIHDRGTSASARALTGEELGSWTARQILERVTSDSAKRRELIVQLSITLSNIEDTIAKDLLLGGQAPPSVVAERAASGTTAPADATVTLSAQSEVLRALMGAAPIHNARLPFLVGRVPLEDEVKPSRRPDLLLGDEEPFRLSRRHFMIARTGGRLVVSDLGSTLGTIVNGQPIGDHFGEDTAPLRRGENRILAGGPDSPFEFLVSVN